ncbi:hypothetical protein [Campylobacter estrildidarum]|uniref:LPS export ABC transporter periplasmic protein LptC n=1 Tax=Campylobacter estrildidarum TaxID=2510189 RepID=A0A4U7BUE1_9BACT|nr:hypothetical protein [Campylobacter estrildidarum]TKX31977.1 hypothetical protein CQA69_00225 [Campylobacter estrildidarum]
MAIKIFGILIALFAITFIVLSLQDPYSLDIKSYSLNFKNIEANHLKAYDINQTAIKSYYKANSWIRYTNKDEFDHFTNFNLDFNLSADKLVLLGQDIDKIKFEGNVTYLGLNNIKFIADEIEYEPKSKILSTNTGFNGFINENIINGKSLQYDIKNKILRIQGVDAWLQEK